MEESGKPGNTFSEAVKQQPIFLGGISGYGTPFFDRRCRFHGILPVHSFDDSRFAGEPVGVLVFLVERRVADIRLRDGAVVAGE